MRARRTTTSRPWTTTAAGSSGGVSAGARNVRATRRARTKEGRRFNRTDPPGGGSRGTDLHEAAAVGFERLRHGHRAVGPLVVLQKGDERPPHGQAGAVQRVNELVPDSALPLDLRPDRRSPGLEVAKVRAGGD